MGRRRVKAITGVGAVNLNTREWTSLEQTGRQFRGSKRPVEESVAGLLERIISLRRRWNNFVMSDYLHRSMGQVL